MFQHILEFMERRHSDWDGRCSWKASLRFSIGVTLLFEPRIVYYIGATEALYFNVSYSDSNSLLFTTCCFGHFELNAQCISAAV